MADNHSSQSHLHPHHAHQASTAAAAAGSSSHHHSARSSDFIVAVSGNGGNGRENSSGNGPGSGVSGHHNNRSSPNASGQYVRTRIRTSFDTEMELPKLHKWFGENQHPTRQQIQQYVRELNSLESRRGRKPLDVNNVVYWFKNARAAHKRHELKIVNGSQSPTLSNNILTGHSIHPKDGQDGRSGLAGRGQNDRRNDRSGNSNNLGGTLSGLHNSGLNSNRGLNEPYHDSNGNEEMGYDDDGSEGQDEYGPDGDDMMMDDDCSSQISQTLDLSVRPVKRQRSDSSPPGSPCTVPSSLSDLMGGTSPHLTAHPHFTVKDEPPSDEEDEDDSDATDDKDYYNIRHLGSGHSTSTTGPHSGGAGSGLVPSGYCGSESSLNGGNSRSHFNNNGSGQLSSHPDSPEEGRRIRRSRTFIDPTTEVPKLEQWFSLCTHPSQPQIVKYTDELNSSPYRLKYPKLESKNIQFWFKNRRAKSKRQNVPTSTANNNNNSVSSGNNGGHSGPQLGSSLSSLSSNCSVSSLSLAASSGPVSTPVSSSALTIDRLIGH